MMHGEPSLDELLEEPIVRLMMAADGVHINDLRALLLRIRDRFKA